MIKYIKSVLWRVAKRLSYIEDARCLKVNLNLIFTFWRIIYAKRNLCVILCFRSSGISRSLFW